jgi:hypothetical protein
MSDEGRGEDTKNKGERKRNRQGERYKYIEIERV